MDRTASGSADAKIQAIIFAKKSMALSTQPDQYETRAVAALLISINYSDLAQLDSALHYGNKLAELGRAASLAMRRSTISSLRA